MITTSKKNSIEKHSVDQRFSFLGERSFKDISNFPASFKYLISGEINTSKINKRALRPDDFYNTIHICSSNNFYSIERSSPDKKTVRLNSSIKHLPSSATSNSRAFGNTNVIFEILDSSGQVAPIAGLYKASNYLIIGYVPLSSDTYTRNALSIPKEWIKVIREIFVLVSKMKLKTKRVLHNKLMMGCDTEFMLLDSRGEVLSANKHLPGGTTGKIGNDGHPETAELRPAPFHRPEFLVDRGIRPLMVELKKILPPGASVLTGGGSKREAPLGDHIHFNKILSVDEIELLDTFIGIPSTKMEGGDRPSTTYGKPGDVRMNAHGCEYRTCPSGLIPDLLKARYVTAYCVIKYWESLNPGEKFEFSVDDNGIPTLSSYINICTIPKYKKYVESFHNWVTTGKIDKRDDALKFWVKPKGVKSRVPRAIIEEYPSWWIYKKVIPVNGLRETKKISIKSYTEKYLAAGHNIPDTKNTLIVEFPPEVYARISESESERKRLSIIKKSLQCSVAFGTTVTSGINILFPSSWRTKTDLITPSIVRKIVKFAYE